MSAALTPPLRPPLPPTQPPPTTHTFTYRPLRRVRAHDWLDTNHLPHLHCTSQILRPSSLRSPFHDPSLPSRFPRHHLPSTIPLPFTIHDPHSLRYILPCTIAPPHTPRYSRLPYTSPVTSCPRAGNDVRISSLSSWSASTAASGESSPLVASGRASWLGGG